MKKISSKFNSKIKNISSRIPVDYATFLKTVKDRIRAAQLRATLAVNSEMIGLYWDIGQSVARAQIREGVHRLFLGYRRIFRMISQNSKVSQSGISAG